MLAVLGLTLDEAKNIALVAATAFAILAIAAIWVMNTIVQKVLVALLLVMLAFAAWSQRASLQECAEKVQANVSASISGAATSSVSPPATTSPTTEGSGTPDVATSSGTDTTCTFFGVDVTIP